MTYAARYQGHPVRFVQPRDGSASCALIREDVMHVLADAGVPASILAAAPELPADPGILGFTPLIHWIEAVRAAGCRQVEMFQHWLLRHMPSAQLALGLPLVGYLQAGPAFSALDERSADDTAPAGDLAAA